MITDKQFMDLLRDVVEKQGYFVIGCPPDSPRYFLIGEKTNKIMQFFVDQTFVVAETARQSDWSKQNDLIASLSPDWIRFPEPKGGAFFKVKPEVQHERTI